MSDLEREVDRSDQAQEAISDASKPVAGSLRTRLISGSAWSFVGSALSQGMTFLALVSCARILGKQGFGELAMVRNTVVTFGTFIGVGLGLTATKYVAEFRDSSPQRAVAVAALCSRIAYLSGIVLAGVLVLVAAEISRSVLAAPNLTMPLMIAAPLLLFYAVDGAQKGVLAGFEAYRTTAWINACAGVSILLFGIAGARIGGVSGAIQGFAISGMVVLVLNVPAIRRVRFANNMPERSESSWAERGILWRFALPAFLCQWLGVAALWAGSLMLVRQPDGYAQMGVMAAIDNLRLMALFVPISTLRCLLPILSNEMGKQTSTFRTDKLHIINSYTAFYSTTCITAIALFFIAPLLSMFGRDFEVGKTAAVIVLCALPIATYRDGIHRLLQARDLLWYSFLIYLLWALTFVAFAGYLVRYGIVGIASAYFLAYLLNSALVLPSVLAKTRMKRHLGREFTLIGILTLSLLPGIGASLYPVSTPMALACGAATLAMLALAGSMLARWYNCNTGSVTVED